MPTTFVEDDGRVADIIGKLLSKFYRDFFEADVTIKFLFAINAEALGGPLKKNGLPVPYKLKINNLQARTEGLTDATVTIAQEWWEGHSETECAAMLDQALYSLMLAHDDDGKAELDDVGRPKLSVRPVDFRVDGYNEVAKRHADAALEVRGIVDVAANAV